MDDDEGPDDPAAEPVLGSFFGSLLGELGHDLVDITFGTKQSLSAICPGNELTEDVDEIDVMESLR